MDLRFLFILAVLACASCRVASSCPKRCTCHFGNRTTEVVCPDATLSLYPSDSLPGNSTSVTIQFTNLSSITAGELKATPVLQELHLPGNVLGSLPADLLLDLTHLHTIDLTGNQLEELPAHVFHHAPLLNLVLKDNLLTGAGDDWLPSNSNLTWLDLSGNKLRKIPFALLRHLSRLETLHLSQNGLEEIPARSFHSAPDLERLHLDQNKLVTLDAEAFAGITNLTHLFLQKNRLESLPASVFLPLRRLRYLDLSENRLRFLSPDTLGAGLEWAELSLNPWHCDEKVRYLWGRLNRGSLGSEPTCASPDKLKDRAIATLTQHELGLND